MAKAQPKVTKSQKSTEKTLKTTPLQQAILDAKAYNPRAKTVEIAKELNCDHSTVVKCLQRFGIRQAELEQYKHGRADILAGIQGRILASLSHEDIKKATLNQKVISYGILYDKERIERGLSTANVAHLHKLSEDTAEMLTRITGGQNEKSV